MYLNSNLKILRKRRKQTQDDVAFGLDVPRPTYSGYENKVSFPSLLTLVKISDYFSVSIDALLKVDFSKIPDRELGLIESGSDVYIKGAQIRILSATVDNNNDENIELVNAKAKAGYTRGFADPEFIQVLPSFQLPFLSREKKYRSFQISGDSMLPIPDGSYITGEFIQNWFSLKDGDACIILTFDDGIVFKCVENKLREHKKLGVYSLNSEYQPYSIDAGDIREVWRFVNYISPEMPKVLDDTALLHKDIANLKENMQKIMLKIDTK